MNLLRSLGPALRRLAVWSLFASTPLLAQPSPPPGAGDVLLEVGRESFTAQEIANAFNRNANRGGSTFYQLDRDSALAFLNLYANYRLKVQAALDAGIDRRPEVVEDLRNNRIQLAVPPPPATGYLIERKVVDPAVERIFERRSDELLIALIYKSMNAEDPTDTLRAYQTVLGMLERIRQGIPFEGIARDSSDDPGTKERGGVLPNWITAGMILPAIEDAAYELKPGGVAQRPIRVPGGYVLIKLIARAPRFKVRAAHILIEAEPTTPDSGDARARAEAALARIRAGEDFAKVAREVSNDRVSGEQGGDFMGYYTRSLGFEAKNARLDPTFEEALFALSDGQVSNVVRTQYGFHIIKRLHSARPTFDEEKETIRQFYKQRLMADDRAAFVRSVVEKQGLRMDLGVFRQFVTALPGRGVAADTAWERAIGPGLRRETLFTFAGRPYTVGAWVDSLRTRPDLRATALNAAGMEQAIYTTFEQEALIAESARLEEEYPEFAALMREFRDGILIFNLEDETIWKKLNRGYDEDRGRALFAKNRDRYMNLPKLAMTEIFVYDRKEADELMATLKRSPGLFDSLAASRTQRPGYRDRKGKWGLSDPRNSDLVAKTLERVKNPKVGEILEPAPYQSGFTILRVDQYEPPRQMTYEEAKPEVQSDFVEQLQKDLTEEWLRTLRTKYRVKINDRTLKRVLAAR